MQKSDYLSTTFLVLFIGLCSISTAQYRLSVAGGVSNEKEHNSYGNHLRLYYNFTDNFRLGSEFVRFYYVEEKNEDEAFGYDYRELNLTCNYTAFIGEKQRFGIYGMLGFLSTYGRKVTKNATDTSEKFVERVGITAGFGLLYQLGRFTPYIESRSVTAGSEFYLVHSLGLTYSFGKRDD